MRSGEAARRLVDRLLAGGGDEDGEPGILQHVPRQLEVAFVVLDEEDHRCCVIRPPGRGALPGRR